MSIFFEESQVRPRYIGINDKSVVIPFAKQDGLTHKYGSLQKLRARINNLVLNNCNSGDYTFKNTNIDLVIDPHTKELLLSATGNGKICLNVVDPSLIQSVVNEENPDLRIKIIRN